jgi:hypothetical protein
VSKVNKGKPNGAKVDKKLWMTINKEISVPWRAERMTGMLIWSSRVFSYELHVQHQTMLYKKLLCLLSVGFLKDWDPWSIYQSAALIERTNQSGDYLLEKHGCHLSNKALAKSRYTRFCKTILKPQACYRYSFHEKYMSADMVKLCWWLNFELWEDD